MKKLSGIYCIENLKNGKRYIGQAIDLEIRRKRHFRALDGKYHTNQHLQNSYNKYGKKYFKYYVLVYCEEWELERLEIECIRIFSSHTSCGGYNISFGGNAPMKGRKHSKKSIEKMRGENNHNYGKPMCENQKKKISEAQLGDKNHMYGKTTSEETRKKISDKLKGEKAYWYGKALSEETKRKLSKANLGKTLSEETKTKISKANLGRVCSDKTKKKLSETRTGENNPFSKLREIDVLEIYKLLKIGNLSQTEIANIYNVSPMSISFIKKGKRWSYLYDNFREEERCEK